MRKTKVTLSRKKEKLFPHSPDIIAKISVIVAIMAIMQRPLLFFLFQWIFIDRRVRNRFLSVHDRFAPLWLFVYKFFSSTFFWPTQPTLVRLAYFCTGNLFCNGECVTLLRFKTLFINVKRFFTLHLIRSLIYSPSFFLI